MLCRRTSDTTLEAGPFLLRHSQMHRHVSAPDQGGQLAASGAVIWVMLAASCLQSDLSSRFWCRNIWQHLVVS